MLLQFTCSVDVSEKFSLYEEWRKQLTYRAEYLWIDGAEPTAEIRSKTKILADGDEPGIWLSLIHI